MPVAIAADSHGVLGEGAELHQPAPRGEQKSGCLGHFRTLVSVPGVEAAGIVLRTDLSLRLQLAQA